MTDEKQILEENFPLEYREDVVGQMCDLISRGESFSFIGMKDNCKVNVLRFLAMRPDVQNKYLGEKAEDYLWVMVNLDELTESNITAFYHLLGASLVEMIKKSSGDWNYLNNLFIDSPAVLIKAIKEDLGEIVRKTGKSIVILFSNFDLAKKLDLQLVYHQLVAIRQATRYKISFVFGGTKPFEVNHFFFRKIIWMTPFKGEDAMGVVERNEKRYKVKLTVDQGSEIIRLSGGHAGTIKFLIQGIAFGGKLGESEDTNFQCERILSTFTDLERAKLKSNQYEEILIKMGLQLKVGEKVINFSPLLDKYFKKEECIIPVFCRDEENDEIYCLGKPLKKDLSFKEYALLKLLMTKPGKVFSREEIMNRVWGEEGFPSDWALDKTVSRLREKVGSKYLQAIRGQGLSLMSGLSDRRW